MTISRDELARRLRRAREACSITQQDVASALGVSRPTVAQIEAGNRAVTSLELDRLAHLYGVDMRSFFDESFGEQDALSVLFRAQADVTEDGAVMEGLRECLHLARAVTRLEGLVGIDRALGVASYPIDGPPSRWQAIRQGERIADEERRRLGLGTAPAPDLSELLEHQGIRTAIHDLPDDVSGMTLFEREAGLFVVANEGQHVVRRRFSFAHEYAHVLLDRDRKGLVSRYSDRDDLLEVRANAFAAAFLMPADGVREYVATLGKGQPSRMRAEVHDEEGAVHVEGRTQPGSQAIKLYDIVQVAHHFGVSRITAIYRLKNLGLITNSELDELRALDAGGRGKDIERTLGWPEPDHAADRNWFRSRFVGLGLEALRRGAITRAKLRELLALIDLDAAALDRLLADAGLEVEDEGDVLVPD